MEATAAAQPVTAPVEDTIGGDADKLPASVRKVLAYATGGSPIQWTQAQAEAIERRGGRVIWVDQSDGTVTRLGDIDDVEDGAKTLAHAIAKSIARKRIGWHSCVYLSLSRLAAARQEVAANGLEGWVTFDVADWGITRDEAIGRLGGDIACVQYASPTDQGGLTIPGSNLTLKEANADLSVSLASWFPIPSPAKPPVVGHAGLTLTEAGVWEIHSLPGEPIHTGEKTWAAKVTTRNGAWDIKPLPPE